MIDFTAFVIKLSLAILAFVIIAWFGARDKRIGGVLLTFPLLNGIAMLTGIDPLGIADIIYLVVIWNSLLFLVAMYYYEWLPPLPVELDPDAKINGRALFWIVLWVMGAGLLTLFRDDFPSAWWLFGVQLVLATMYIATRWRQTLSPSSVTFWEMWNNWRGYVRIGSFIGVFLLLSLIAYAWQSARWVGWASALPLPGIFALATLSATQKKEDVLSLADTVLLGPLLVIPFNWLLAHAIVHLRVQDASVLVEIAIVVVFWIVAAVAVLAMVPRFAHWRDGLSFRH